MDDRFYNAFLPPEARIAGFRLRVCSLWHYLLLQAIDSPLLKRAAKIRPADLLVAVKIMQAKPGKQPKLRPSPLDLWRRWRWRKSAGKFKADAETFAEWMQLQTSPPRYWIENSHKGKRSMIDREPRILAMLVALMNGAGMSRTEAWACPLGQAMWIEAQCAKRQGAGLCYLDDDDLVEGEIDMAAMTDDEALAQFRASLPEEIAMRTFENWKREKEARPC